MLRVAVHVKGREARLHQRIDRLHVQVVGGLIEDLGSDFLREIPAAATATEVTIAAATAVTAGSSDTQPPLPIKPTPTAGQTFLMCHASGWMPQGQNPVLGANAQSTLKAPALHRKHAYFSVYSI